MFVRTRDFWYTPSTPLKTVHAAIPGTSAAARGYGLDEGNPTITTGSVQSSTTSVLYIYFCLLREALHIPGTGNLEPCARHNERKYRGRYLPAVTKFLVHTYSSTWPGTAVVRSMLPKAIPYQYHVIL